MHGQTENRRNLLTELNCLIPIAETHRCDTNAMEEFFCHEMVANSLVAL